MNYEFESLCQNIFLTLILRIYFSKNRPLIHPEIIIFLRKSVHCSHKKAIQSPGSSLLFLEWENEWLVIAVIFTTVGLFLDLGFLGFFWLLFALFLVFRCFVLILCRISTTLLRHDPLHVKIFSVFDLILSRLLCIWLLFLGRSGRIRYFARCLLLL